MTQTVTTKDDVYSLPNGAIVTFKESQFMKIRTDKDQWGSPEGIHVVNMETDTSKQLRSVNDVFALVDRDTIAFSNGDIDPEDIEHTDTDKEQLMKYINQINSGEL